MEWVLKIIVIIIVISELAFIISYKNEYIAMSYCFKFNFDGTLFSLTVLYNYYKIKNLYVKLIIFNLWCKSNNIITFW